MYEGTKSQLCSPAGRSCTRMWRCLSGTCSGKMSNTLAVAPSLTANLEKSAPRDFTRSTRVSSGFTSSGSWSYRESQRVYVEYQRGPPSKAPEQLDRCSLDVPVRSNALQDKFLQIQYISLVRGDFEGCRIAFNETEEYTSCIISHRRDESWPGNTSAASEPASANLQPCIF
jgi:hypothetical protein